MYMYDGARKSVLLSQHGMCESLQDYTTMLCNEVVAIESGRICVIPN